MKVSLPQRSIDFPRRPLIMGIVNVNDDSFSGDGSLDIDTALAQARQQIIHGADLIDIGAESARTNRCAIPIEEEIRRFHNFIERWDEAVEGTQPRDPSQVWPPALSANTWRPEVVEKLLPLGKIDLLNDMSALPDDRNARLCAEHGTALLLMHSVGEPKIPQTHQSWHNVMDSLDDFFEEKLHLCQQAGLPVDATIIDPGIDFAKQRDDNLCVMRDLARLHKFKRPILVPVSRKTVIGEVLDIEDPAERDAGTMACIAACHQQGAHLFRVHNVNASWQVLRTLEAVEKQNDPAM